jgi:hypothetical protein
LEQPGAKDGLDGTGVRDCSLLAAFAVAAHVRAGAEGDVAAVESEHFGDP